MGYLGTRGIENRSQNLSNQHELFITRHKAGSALLTDHILNVLSSEDETSQFLSWLQPTALTAPSCPNKQNKNALGRGEGLSESILNPQTTFSTRDIFLSVCYKQALRSQD